MRTTSAHPNSHIGIDLHCAVSSKKVFKALGSLFKKVFESSEKAAAIAVVLLIASIVVFAVMTLGAANAVTASYCEAVTKVVCVP
jgi:ABC-type transport system involved in multi-copper enzyme maturation permease subunit